MEIENCVQSSIDWVDYLSALLTPTIAILGSVIAYLQWRINKARLKHELFDRRYDQFLTVRNFLGSIITTGEVKQEEQGKFLVGTRGMRFTFDKKIAIYNEEVIWKLAIDLEVLQLELDDFVLGKERSTNIYKQAEIKKQLMKELSNLNNKFSDYLQLEH